MFDISGSELRIELEEAAISYNNVDGNQGLQILLLRATQRPDADRG